VTLEQRWSALHSGIDPARVPLLMPWLRFLWRVARPLSVLPPMAITVLGVVLAWDAVLMAGSVPWAAGVSVLLAAACDGLDGAIAVVADRATQMGARADAIADRLSDIAFALVLWRCGAPWPVAIACAALAVAVDAVRRVRRRPAQITVAERPTWTICAALACGSAAATSAAWPVLVCAAVWLGFGVVGVMQLVVERGASRR
jgi:CDP-diacylglycerol--glycerol-3-phosphate 3-phosphatidyltransferase